MADLAIGGVVVIALIAGMVEFSKKLGVSGNGLIIESLVLTIVFGGLALAIQLGYIPDPAKSIIIFIVSVLSFGLGTTGLYDITKRATGMPDSK